MKLKPLTLLGALLVLKWREPYPQNFRTPKQISEDEQRDWYCDLQFNKTMKFFQVEDENEIVSVCGFTHIEQSNKRAQISLVCKEANHGLGSASLDLMLEKAAAMGLYHLYAEVYLCNPFKGAWEKMARKRGAVVSHLPNTKIWEGKYYGSAVYTFKVQDYG